MNYHVLVSDTLRGFIKHLSPSIKKKIKQALKEISKDPHAGKPLIGKLAGLHSYKIGMIRVVYRPDNSQTVTLLAIGPRKTIYQKMTQEMIARL